MTFQFIQDHAHQWPVTRMCRILGVSVSGYYAWSHRRQSPHDQRDQQLGQQIQVIHHQSRKAYGCPRIHAELQARGVRCSRKRVGRLMRQHGLTHQRKRRTIRTTDSNHANPVAPNLLNQEFTATEPNSKWVTDITYVATDEGWLYLAALQDVYSRRIVGWAMSEHCDETLVTCALQMALARRVPAERMVHHSDRGSQYTSKGYQALLREHGIQLSMSRTGNCYDNALVESLWARLKVECLYEQRFQTHRQARSAIFDYIEVFYNRQRRHSSLGYLSPVAFETNQSQSVGSPTP